MAPDRWLNGAIAVSLGVGCFFVLASTEDMGFTRDESFYFKYAEVYQGWFTRVGQQIDGEPVDALGRRDVVHTWSQNFEHPPLMKVLFGLSWRVFAEKHRAITSIRPGTQGNHGRLKIRLHSIADGFETGASVRLLGPMPVGSTQSEPGRQKGWGTVIKNDGQYATVEPNDLDLKAFNSTCTAPAIIGKSAPHPWVSGCQAVEDGLMTETSAMRLPAWVMSGLLAGLLFLLGAELFSRSAGLFAALSFFAVPRQFFHAHLCTFDVAVTTVSIATLYAFWRSLRSRKWAIATGVVWGIALLTKLNAFFIPIPLVAWWLLAQPPKLERTHPDKDDPPWAIHAILGALTVACAIWVNLALAVCVSLLWLVAARRTIHIQTMPTAFLWMPPLGLLILFLGWPRLWYDPALAFSDYIGFHFNHVHYLQHYFGNILSVPPFPATYPLVMTVLTVPLVLLAIFVLGSVALFWIDRTRVGRDVRLFVVINLVFPILLISLPNTPVFGGVKHWFLSMAFFALVAGYGFDWLRQQLIATRLDIKPLRWILTVGLIATLLVPGSIASLKYRKFGTGYYNALIGGVRGAAESRMHRQFWGYAGRYGLDWVNRHAPANATVAFHNTTWDAVEWYRRIGLLRHDIRWRRDPPSNCSDRNGIYLFHHQESFAQDRLDAWEKLGTWIPEEIIGIDGVPMLSVYRCRSANPGGST